VLFFGFGVGLGLGPGLGPGPGSYFSSITTFISLFVLSYSYNDTGYNFALTDTAYSPDFILSLVESIITVLFLV